METYSAVYVFVVAPCLIFLLTMLVKSGISAQRARALRKQGITDRTTGTTYHVVLSQWHSLLVESGYMGSVIMMQLRPGDVVKCITDDPDQPDKYPLKPPFRALDKGTLFIYVNDLEGGKVDYEWRRLRA